MKCIIYAAVATSQLLFTSGCEIMWLAVRLELKVHATITCEGEDKACCLSATSLRSEGWRHAALIRSSTTTSANERDLYASLWQQQLFVKGLLLCGKQSVNTKRCVRSNLWQSDRQCVETVVLTVTMKDTVLLCEGEAIKLHLRL